MKATKEFRYAIGGVNVVTYQVGDDIEDEGAQAFAKAQGYADGGKRATKKPGTASTRDKAGSGGNRNKGED